MYLLVLLVAAVLLDYISGEESFPKCGDCWCIPGNSGADPCPYSDEPQSSYSPAIVEIYRNQAPNNPYSLFCNPYKDKNCQTFPVQQYLGTDTAVCAFVYPKENGEESCTTYSIQTFPSRDEAEKAGAVITHEGSCGLCSTAVDLALYLSTLIYLFTNFR